MRNSIELHWWGIELYMDETTTVNVLTLIDSGGDAAAVLAVVDPEIKSKIVIGLTVAITKIGAKVIKKVDEDGGKHGVIIKHPWIGPIPGWVVAQT